MLSTHVTQAFHFCCISAAIARRSRIALRHRLLLLCAWQPCISRAAAAVAHLLRMRQAAIERGRGVWLIARLESPCRQPMNRRPRRPLGFAPFLCHDGQVAIKGQTWLQIWERQAASKSRQLLQLRKCRLFSLFAFAFEDSPLGSQQHAFACRQCILRPLTELGHVHTKIFTRGKL